MHNKVFKSSGVINKLNIFVFLLPVVTVDKYDFKIPARFKHKRCAQAQMQQTRICYPSEFSTRSNFKNHLE
jgi:hypothetical protein